MSLFIAIAKETVHCNTQIFMQLCLKLDVPQILGVMQIWLVNASPLLSREHRLMPHDMHVCRPPIQSWTCRRF